MRIYKIYFEDGDDVFKTTEVCKNKNEAFKKMQCNGYGKESILKIKDITEDVSLPNLDYINMCINNSADKIGENELEIINCVLANSGLFE